MRRIDRGRWTRVLLGVALGLVFFAGWLVVLGVIVGQERGAVSFAWEGD